MTGFMHEADQLYNLINLEHLVELLAGLTFMTAAQIQKLITTTDFAVPVLTYFTGCVAKFTAN